MYPVLQTSASPFRHADKCGLTPFGWSSREAPPQGLEPRTCPVTADRSAYLSYKGMIPYSGSSYSIPMGLAQVRAYSSTRSTGRSGMR